MATGPSLRPEDVAGVRGKAAVLVVNDAWRLAPWADALYAADPGWWEHHTGVQEFTGEKWTQSERTAVRFDLNWIPGEYKDGLCLEANKIHFGGNSGFQALNLAVHFGAREIALLGYDMQGGFQHFFGEHPEALRRISPFKVFRDYFDKAVPGLEVAGVNVTNCTQDTALTTFPCLPIKDWLANHGNETAPA